MSNYDMNMGETPIGDALVAAARGRLFDLVRTSSFPYRAIAAHFGLPYWAVLSYPDAREDPQTITESRAIGVCGKLTAAEWLTFRQAIRVARARVLVSDSGVV